MNITSLKKMSQKLLGNKMFMYLMIIVTLAHALSYLINRQYNTLSFLCLSAVIIYQMNRNTSFILLSSLFLTHFFMAGRIMYEGLENNDTTKKDETIDKLKAIDPEMGDAAKVIGESGVTVEQAQKIIGDGGTDANKKDDKSKLIDQNNSELNAGSESSSDPKPEAFEGGKKGTVRLDHAATLEDAYDNLQTVLGGDGINKLTQDTQKLMKQQQQLFNTMNTLTPAVTETMKMLEGMDLNKFTSLGGNMAAVTSNLKGFLGKGEPAAANEKKK